MRWMQRILVALCVSTPALAQDAPEQERRTVFNPRTEIDFEAVDVTAGLDGPSIDWVLERRRGEFPPMFRLRGDFDHEMKRSTDQVK